MFSGLVLFAVLSVAQWGGRDDREQTIHFTEGGFGWGAGRGVRFDEETTRTAREVATHSSDVPIWTNAPGFESDAFTFCRVRFISDYTERRRSSGNWCTDFPDSDMNLSFRLQQMTSLKVNPDGRFLRLNNQDLPNYPWIYMVEPGRLRLDDEEVKILRDYLSNGGFLMADDFWGDAQWENFEREMKRVLPERQFVELPMDHPVFHMVFDLRGPETILADPQCGDSHRESGHAKPLFRNHLGNAQRPQRGRDARARHAG